MSAIVVIIVAVVVVVVVIGTTVVAFGGTYERMILWSLGGEGRVAVVSILVHLGRELCKE